MFVKNDSRTKELRQNLYGDNGDVIMHHVVEGELMPKGSRLVAEVSLAPGQGIGWHVHSNETEIYLMTAGEAVVDDNGTEYIAHAGDVVVTPNGYGHSIFNRAQSGEVKFTAIIILD